VDAVGLDGTWNVNQILVKHGHESGVMPGRQVAVDLLEGVDVLAAVVGRQGDAGEQNPNMRAFERREHLIEIAARLLRGQATETVVTAEFDDHHLRVQEQNGLQVGDRVLGGGSAGAMVRDFVAVAATVEVFLQGSRVGLAGLETVACGDAVAIADQLRPVRSQ